MVDQKYIREQVDYYRAQRKAYDLLVSYLDPIQKWELQNRDGFAIVAQSGFVYWVSKGYIYQIISRDDGTVLMIFCVRPLVHEIFWDYMLSVKLLLETSEEKFLNLANAYAPHRMMKMFEVSY